MHQYKIFGLNFLSEIQIPYACKASFAEPDVTFSFGDVPDILSSHAQQLTTCCMAAPGEALFHLPFLGKYYIQGGKHITVAPLMNGDPQLHHQSDIILFLMGSIMASLMIMRDHLTLHANAIEYAPGKVFLLAGHSGVGKSTLSTALVQKGYRLICDDLSPVCFVREKPVVFPGRSALKIWQKTCQMLGINYEDLENIRYEIKKYYMPTPQPLHQPYEVTDIFILNHLTNGKDNQLVKLPALAAFRMLNEHTKGNKFLNALGKKGAHLALLEKILPSVNVHHLYRTPNAKFHLPIELIEEAVMNEALHAC